LGQLEDPTAGIVGDNADRAFTLDILVHQLGSDDILDDFVLDDPDTGLFMSHRSQIHPGGEGREVDGADDLIGGGLVESSVGGRGGDCAGEDVVCL